MVLLVSRPSAALAVFRAKFADLVIFIYTGARIIKSEAQTRAAIQRVQARNQRVTRAQRCR